MTIGAIPVSTLSVAGDTVDGPETIEVRSPFTDAVVGRVPQVGADAVTAAVDAAFAAMKEGLPAFRRAEILDEAATIVKARRDRFAALLTQEVAKPVTQAGIEVDRAVQTLKFSACEARTLAGDVIPMDAHPTGVGHIGWSIRVPTGVIGAITPFNFPLNLAAHKVGPAVAAGCGVVLKPPRSAPLTAIALADAFYEAGLPREWMSVVVGAANEIGDVLVEDPRVSMITFTGSSQVGWELAARAPRKHVALELGNSTPVIICADADLDKAANTLAGSAFVFAGQSCISVQRLIVHESVRESFTDRLLAATATVRAGDPAASTSDLGPLIDTDASKRVVSWIDEARAGGASVLAGGAFDGKLLAPTVLSDVASTDRVWSKEVFGPVVSMRTFSELDEAIADANNTEHGLQAGIYTADIQAALRATAELNFGGVTVNETPSFRVEQMPYGGTKESGNTREGPRYTVRAMTEERMVVIRL